MQSEYFVIESAASNDHPMMEWDEYLATFGGPRPFKPLGRPIKLRLGKPIPKNPVMVDHHELPSPVFSARLKDALEPLELHGVQFILRTSRSNLGTCGPTGSCTSTTGLNAWTGSSPGSSSLHTASP